jgi:hypothetical protein
MEITRPNQVWAMDITYIPMARGFVYRLARGVLRAGCRGVRVLVVTRPIDFRKRADGLVACKVRRGTAYSRSIHGAIHFILYGWPFS